MKTIPIPAINSQQWPDKNRSLNKRQGGLFGNPTTGIAEI